MRRLRYGDGLAQERVGELVGCSHTTVRRHAPGRPGKVSNEAVRRIFREEQARRGLTAIAVARELGWGSSRVYRTLGLRQDVDGRGHRSFRKMIDAENAEQLAEAMGRARHEAHG